MKQQRILLFSDHQRSAADLPLRRSARYELTHCASDNQRIDAIDGVQQRFDWILVDGAMMDGDQMEFIRSLRAMGLLYPESGRGVCNHRSCKVEWDANGILQLHCCQQGNRGGYQPDRQNSFDGNTESFIFEYHAPMKRTG